MESNFASTDAQARGIILSSVRITSQMVAISKGLIVDCIKGTESADGLISTVVKRHGISTPSRLTLHKSIDSSRDLEAVARAISWNVSTAEALLSLVYNGCLIATTKDVHELRLGMDYFMGYPGSGGNSGRLSFAEYSVVVPAQVRLAFSFAGATDQMLAEPDLYLAKLNIPNMHAEIMSAFREAVLCFRSNFFNATVAMLGKASEGAWIELGTALVRAVPADKKVSIDNHRKILENSRDGAAKKIDSILELFKRQDIFAGLATLSGVSLDLLRSIWEWSNLVRNSRNTIHFGVSPIVPITYETVAVLLLGAIPNVQCLYRLKNAADDFAGSRANL